MIVFIYPISCQELKDSTHRDLTVEYLSTSQFRQKFGLVGIIFTDHFNPKLFYLKPALFYCASERLFLFY